MTITEQAGYFVVECATRVRLGADVDAVANEIVDWALAGPEPVDERAYHVCIAALATASKMTRKVAAQQGRSIELPDDVWRLAKIPADDADPDVEVIGQVVAAMAREDLTMAYALVTAHYQVAGAWGMLGAAAGTTGLVVCLMEEDPTLVIGQRRSA